MTELDRARALLQLSAGYFVTALGATSEPDLGRSTPCPEWTVHDLVSHVAEAVDELTSRAGGTPAVTHAGAGLMGHARARVSHLLATIDTADGGDESMVAAAYGGAIELAVHGWDLNVAITGAQLVDAHADELLGLAASLVNDEARARFFGPEVVIHGVASPPDRFVAFLGRDPAWKA